MAIDISASLGGRYTLDDLKHLVVNRRESLLSMGDTEADSLMSLLQYNLDKMTLSDEHRGAFIDTLLQLAIKASIVPKCLEITGEISRTEEPITTGGFGDVYKAYWNNTTVALKRLREIGGIDKLKLHRNLCKEVLLWRQLRHSNILEFLGICKDAFSSPSIVSPWMVNGNVLQFVQAKGLKLRPKKMTIFKLLSQVAQALAYLHNQKPVVVHQDVRCANILVNGANEAVLSDFGLSRLDSDFFNTFTSSLEHGCLRWQAPELLFPEAQLQAGLLLGSDSSEPTETEGEDLPGSQPKPTPSSDVYALGMTALELTTGKKPFSPVVLDAAVIIEIYHDRRPGRPWDWDEVDWSFLLTCWSKAPADRPSANEVSEYLSAVLEHCNAQELYNTDQLHKANIFDSYKGHRQKDLPGYDKSSVWDDHIISPTWGLVDVGERVYVTHELFAVVIEKHEGRNYHLLEKAYSVKISCTVVPEGMRDENMVEIHVRKDDLGGRLTGAVRTAMAEIEKLIELYERFGHKL